MRNDNCEKKAFRQSQQCLFFSFFDIRYIFSTAKLRRVPYMYERHLPLQNWRDVLCPCKREVPNLANVSTSR